MNEGTFIGFISSDIKGENLTLKSGETMRKIGFNIACQRKGKNAGADFPRVVAFGKTAEVIEKYLGKGKGIIVNFHVQTGSYTNKEGKKVYQTDLVCDSIEFPPVRKDEEFTPVSESNEDYQQQSDTHTEDSSDEGFMDVPDDEVMSDLPFRKH